MTTDAAGRWRIGHSGASSLKLAIPATVLTLSCAVPAGVRESRESAGLPASFGGIGSVTFALPATAIEPADPELSVVMFVTCGEGSADAGIGVGLNGAPKADASATIRIDGGEAAALLWAAHRGVGLLELRAGDSTLDRSMDEGQDELTAMLTGSSDAIVSFEPPGGARHYFRLDMDGLADRIEMCDSGAVDTSQTVRFVTHTAAPRLLNPDRLGRAIQQEYPRELREAGVGGTTVVHVFVSEEGRVEDQVVLRSSGDSELDNAALRAIRLARFAPAINRDRNVALWIEMPITFRAR